MILLLLPKAPRFKARKMLVKKINLKISSIFFSYIVDICQYWSPPKH